MLLFKVDYVDNVCKIHQRVQQCHFNLSGVKLGGDLGEIVALGDEISP